MASDLTRSTDSILLGTASLLLGPTSFEASTFPRRGFSLFALLTSSLPLTDARRRIRSTLICVILATRTAGPAQSSSAYFSQSGESARLVTSAETLSLTDGIYREDFGCGFC